MFPVEGPMFPALASFPSFPELGVMPGLAFIPWLQKARKHNNNGKTFHIIKAFDWDAQLGANHVSDRENQFASLNLFSTGFRYRVDTKTSLTQQYKGQKQTRPKTKGKRPWGILAPTPVTCNWQQRLFSEA